MTIQPSSILKTLVLAGLVLQPLAADAQGTRTAPAPAPRPTTTAPATRPAPPPSTRPVTPATAAPAEATTAGATPEAAASTPAARSSSAIGTTRAAWTDQDYKLGPGDKLRVEIYREPQLSQSLQVRPDGKITLPLVGDVPAASRTSIELRDAIATSLREYITNPVVTVIVQEAVANQVYVIGEVGTPGPQVLQGPLTALQALAQAGGLKEFAKKGDIRILRKNGSTTQTIEFDYKGALKGQADPFALQPGDTIVVP